MLLNRRIDVRLHIFDGPFKFHRAGRAGNPQLVEGFQWIDFQDVDQNVVSFIRRASDPSDFVQTVANFTPVPREGYRLGVPTSGFYRELLNSDASCFGGGNLGNAGGRYLSLIHI